MPGMWKGAMVVLVICLLASMVIGAVRLATTQTPLFGTVNATHADWRTVTERR